MTLSTPGSTAQRPDRPDAPSRQPGGSATSRSRGSASRSSGSAPSTGRPDLVILATAMVAGGVVLTTLPLRSIFSDWAWLVTALLCALPYWMTVGLLRAQGVNRRWYPAAGLLAAAVMVIWVFVPDHLAAGIIPTSGSIGDVRALVEEARRTVADEHTPVVSSPALRLVTSSALVLVVALTDFLCVALRKPVLAAAPLLEILAIASATSGKGANPVWFATAAAGFLLIVLAGTRLQDREWGPSVDGSAGRLGGARQIGVIAILLALILPLALPSVSVNMLARATHHDGAGADGGPGHGGIVLSSFASLRGSLRRADPVLLFTVQTDLNAKPFYLRQTVLDRFTNTGWIATADADSSMTSLSSQDYPSLPALPGSPGAQYSAVFTIGHLTGTGLPLFANPKSLVAPGGGGWDPLTATAKVATLSSGQRYTESVDQPEPSLEALRNTVDSDFAGQPVLDARYRGLPTQPDSVKSLAAKLTAGAASPFDKASAISRYFTDPSNGFVYSLNAPADDGRSALVTFLDKKQGYCQQYAAAAGVLMRLAGLPARVVLGYTHQVADRNGSFTVTTLDAHAWVEVYFDQLGWIPFDPTPLTGADQGRAVQLPWALHPLSTSAPSQEPSDQRSRQTTVSSTAPTLSSSTGAGGRRPASAVPWQGIGLGLAALILLLSLSVGPRAVRRAQRRSRLNRAMASGDPELLWRELAATAVDLDLLWPPTLTVGQVPRWLARRGMGDDSLETVRTVAQRVEVARFSPHPRREITDSETAALKRALDTWTRNRRRPSPSRTARWLPRSLVSRNAGSRR